jgi:hypothetical protein
MANRDDQDQKNQVERAKRLRKQIDAMVKGEPVDDSSSKTPSLREQIEERSGPQDKKRNRD